MTGEVIRFVKGEEGLVLVPYLCPAGYPTIGYGHRIPSLAHPQISEAEADQLLVIALNIAERGAIALCPNLIDHPPRLAPLTGSVFNVRQDALSGAAPSDLPDDPGDTT